MKYSHSITIDLPREKVIAIFDNPDNLAKWQEGLESIEHISGEYGKEGSKTKLIYKSKKRTLEMEETILKKNLPEYYNFLFTAKGVQNWNDNHFESLGENQTKWTQNNVFKCKGMIWLMAALMSGMFKKQSLKYMHDFKRFAETEASNPE